MTNTPTQAELTRYSIDTWFLYGSSIYNTRQDEDGEWCKAADTLVIVAERDKLKAENEALKAQLAEMWQPIDGNIKYDFGYNSGYIRSDLANRFVTVFGKEKISQIELPDNICLCRKVANMVAIPSETIAEATTRYEEYRQAANNMFDGVSTELKESR